MKRRKEREYFEVEAICNCRTCPDTKRKEFLVKWKGFFFVIAKNIFNFPNGFVTQIVVICKSLRLHLLKFVQFCFFFVKQFSNFKLCELYLKNILSQDCLNLVVNI